MKFDVFRDENRASGLSEHVGFVEAETAETALACAELEFECNETHSLHVSPWKLEDLHAGYVMTSNRKILVQVPADNQWGFSLQDDDQTWPGGCDLGEWAVLEDTDPRITDADRERLQWILDEVAAR